MNEKEINQEVLVANALVRIAAIEKILVEKNICSKLELDDITNELTIKLAEGILLQAKISPEEIKKFSEEMKKSVTKK